MNYYERHLGDYARDTGHLSLIEHGAYTKLLDRYYATEAGIPEKEVFKIACARTQSEKKSVSVILNEFFTLNAGVWINSRADEEIKRYKSKQDKAKQSANARWKKSQSHSDGNANASPNAMRTHSDGNAHQSPVTSNHTKALQAASTNSTSSTPEVIHKPEKPVVVETEKPPNGADPITARAIELTVLLRKGGAALTASDPNIRKWAETGISDAQALTALEKAQQLRADKCSPQPINSGYLDSILNAVERSPPGKRGQPVLENFAGKDYGVSGPL